MRSDCQKSQPPHRAVQASELFNFSEQVGALPNPPTRARARPESGAMRRAHGIGQEVCFAVGLVCLTGPRHDESGTAIYVDQARPFMAPPQLIGFQSCQSHGVLFGCSLHHILFINKNPPHPQPGLRPCRPAGRFHSLKPNATIPSLAPNLRVTGRFRVTGRAAPALYEFVEFSVRRQEMSNCPAELVRKLMPEHGSPREAAGGSWAKPGPKRSLVPWPQTAMSVGSFRFVSEGSSTWTFKGVFNGDP